MNTSSEQIAHTPSISSYLGLKSSYSQEVVGRLDSLIDEDLSFVIKRVVIHEGIDEPLANRIRLEFLRFVALRQEYNGILVPSELVDKFWYAFILYTEEYTDFCLRHLGKYMHHRPQDHFASTASISIASSRTMEHLEHMFEDYDKHVWAKSAICTDPGDCGCP